MCGKMAAHSNMHNNYNKPVHIVCITGVHVFIVSLHLSISILCESNMHFVDIN